jgi:hypothetical protein
VAAEVKLCDEQPAGIPSTPCWPSSRRTAFRRPVPRPIWISLDDPVSHGSLTASSRRGEGDVIRVRPRRGGPRRVVAIAVPGSGSPDECSEPRRAIARRHGRRLDQASRLEAMVRTAEGVQIARTRRSAGGGIAVIVSNPMIDLASARLRCAPRKGAPWVHGGDEPGKPRRRIMSRCSQRIADAQDGGVSVVSDHASPRRRRGMVARGVPGDLTR